MPHLPYTINDHVTMCRDTICWFIDTSQSDERYVINTTRSSLWGFARNPILGEIKYIVNCADLSNGGEVRAIYLLGEVVETPVRSSIGALGH